jgi:3-oxoadipate enol-lactonase
MRLKVAPDVSLYYEEQGSGPLLIFNHGLGGSGQGFRAELEYWAPYLRAVLYDQRGCGESDRPQRDEAYLPNWPAGSFSVFVEDLRTLIEQLGASSAILYGVSWGGMLVQKFALTYPQMVQAMVLDSTSSEVNEQAAENWLNRGRTVLEKGYEGLQGLPQRPAFPGNEAILRAPAPAATAEARRADPRAYYAQCAAIASTYREPMTPALRELQTPTLILGGWQDATSGPAGSIKLSKTLPNATIHMWQNTGHGVLRLQNAEAREVMREFFIQHGLLPAGVKAR